MLSPKQFEVLKKGNAAVDADKVKERVTTIFKKATTAQRNEILKLGSFTSPNVFYSSAKKGAVSPRAVLALAQVMSVNPNYLTGESDSEEFEANMLGEFFKKVTAGKEKPAKEKAVKSGKAGSPAKSDKPKKEAKTTVSKAKTVGVAEVAPATEKAAAPAFDKAEVSVATPEPVKAPVAVKPTPKADKPAKIDDASLVKLLEALAIRAKFGGEAETTYNEIVALLVK